MLLAASFVVNIAGGIAFILVGALLLALRPARAGATGFAAFALLAGGQHLFGNLGSALGDAPYGATIAAMRLPFLLLAPAAIVWGAARYRGAGHAAALPFFVLAPVGAALLLVMPERVITPDAYYLPLGDFVFLMPYFVGTAVAILLLAPRLPRERSAALAHETRLLLLATAPPLGYTSAFSLVILLARGDGFDPWVRWGYVATFAFGLVAVAVACAALLRSPHGRTVAVLSVAVAIAAAVQSWLVQEWAQFGGLLRIAAALLLGYALLKYSVFDIDVRVRNALAGMFVGGLAVTAFFVVSEIAETIVENRTGSAVAGLAAAVALVSVETRFVHAGSALARRALPEADGTEAYLASRRLLVYRTAVESAWQDGIRTPSESTILRTLAQDLGLTAAERASIEHEVRASSGVAVS